MGATGARRPARKAVVLRADQSRSRVDPTPAISGCSASSRAGVPPRLRATLAVSFLVGTAFSIFALAWVGRLGAPEVTAGLWLVPGVLAGYLLSSPLTRVLDRGYTRAAVLAVSALAACLVLT